MHSFVDCPGTLIKPAVNLSVNLCIRELTSGITYLIQYLNYSRQKIAQSLKLLMWK